MLTLKDFREIPGLPCNYEAGHNEWFGPGILILSNCHGYKWVVFGGGKYQIQFANIPKPNMASKTAEESVEDLLKSDDPTVVEILNIIFPNRKENI